MKVSDWAAPYGRLMTAPVPSEVSQHLARLCVDTMAIANHARRQGVGATVLDRVGTASGPVAVWGDDSGAAMLDAAFLNGCAAEALDFQEVLIDGRNNGHAAVVIVPALLAATQAHDVDAERLCRALWIGFAANISLARALGRGHRAGETGFRTTSMTAPIAAALAAAHLLSDDPAHATHAAAITAASLPAGLLAAMSPAAGDFSVDKDLSVGFSARHALHCALLSVNGATGPSTALVGPRSWLASYGYGTADPALLAGDPLSADISAYALKLFPANFGCQCAIRLAIDLTAGMDPAEVEAVAVRVKASSAASLSTRNLATHVAARFSLVYAVASAVLRGRSVLSDFDREAFADPTVQGFMDRVGLTGDDDLEALHQRDGIFPARMTVTLRDGTTRSGALNTPVEGLDPTAVDAIMEQKLRDLCPSGLAGQMIDFCKLPPSPQDFGQLLAFEQNLVREG